VSSLAAFWQDLKGGRLKECVEWLGATRSYTIAKVVDPRSGAGLALRAAEEDVLLRILCGEQQKVVSSELGIAHSTTSKRHLHALTKLGLVGRPMPIAVVLAAQCAAQVVVVRTAKTSTFTHDGSTFVVASVPRPTVHGDTVLTRSEREIFTFLVEGCSRAAARPRCRRSPVSFAPSSPSSASAVGTPRSDGQRSSTGFTEGAHAAAQRSEAGVWGEPRSRAILSSVEVPRQPKRGARAGA
jgi:DNA-binding CsgD family transcriptional regulator